MLIEIMERKKSPYPDHELESDDVKKFLFKHPILISLHEIRLLIN